MELLTLVAIFSILATTNANAEIGTDGDDDISTGSDDDLTLAVAEMIT